MNPKLRALQACVAGTLAAFAALGRADAQESAQDAVQFVATADGSEKMPLPSTWTVAPARMGDDVLGGWSVRVPDSDDSAYVLFKMIEGERDERLCTAQIRNDVPDTRFEARPVPHVIYESKDQKGAAVSECRTIRVLKRRGFLIGLQGPKGVFEKALPAFLAGAAKFESQRSEYPDLPDSYRRVLRDGYEYCLHPAVKDADVGPVHKFLLAQEAAYAKRYGPVPKPANNPIVVVLHANADDASKADLPGIKRYGGMNVDPIAGVILALPIPKGDSPYPAELAPCCAFAFHTQLFDVAADFWHVMGDRTLAGVETSGGRPLPEIAESLAARLPSSLHSFADLVAKHDFSTSDQLETAVYLAFFRSGAKPHADGFSSYAKAARDGADAKAACAKFLLSLDQDKLRAAAEAFMKSFKVIKGK